VVIGKTRDFIGLTEPVPLALDVACGTGQSTLALKEIAGADPSEEMLAQASWDERINYVRGSKRASGKGRSSAGVLTVSLALH